MTGRLERQLEDLRRELAATQSLDPQCQVELAKLLPDINRLLGATQGTAPRSFMEVLEAMELRFEAEHPGLAAAVRQVIDTLAAAGI